MMSDPGMGDHNQQAIHALLAHRASRILSAPPADAVFWTGAGISNDLPTGAPIGNALADRTLRHAFAKGTLDTVLESYAALRVDRQRPCLERFVTTLTVAVRA